MDKAIGAILIIAIGFIISSVDKRNRRKRIEAQFGTLASREILKLEDEKYLKDVFNILVDYYSYENIVDNSTWSDLDMFAVYVMLNNT